MNTPRRVFFQTVGFLLPALLVNPLSFLRSLFAPDGELRPLKQQNPNPFVRDGKTLVGIVRGKNVDSMIRESVKVIGGIEKLNVRGKTVLVKPNVVSEKPPPTTTNPEVVGSVVRLLYEAGASKVIVGDMSGLIRLPTKNNFAKTGIGRAAKDAGAEVVDFDEADWIELKPTQAHISRSIYVAKPVYDADLLINLPVVKTHQFATYSICLKNLVGVTHPRNRPYRVNPAKWEEVVAEVNLAVHPNLNIVDATTIMVAGGPQTGTAEATNMIIASGNRVAADVVGLGLIKSFEKWEGVSKTGVWQQRQIRHAQNLGLGIPDQHSIELVEKFLEGNQEEFSSLMEKIKTFLDG